MKTKKTILGIVAAMGLAMAAPSQVPGYEIQCLAAKEDINSKTSNYYYNDNQAETINCVAVNPYKVYYEDDKLIADCYVFNGFNHAVWNISVNGLEIYDLDSNDEWCLIGKASFGGLNNLVIGTHSFAKWQFIFEEDCMKKNAAFEEIAFRSSTSYSY